jgi:hypothetical protein
MYITMHGSKNVKTALLLSTQYLSDFILEFRKTIVSNRKLVIVDCQSGWSSR